MAVTILSSRSGKSQRRSSVPAQETNRRTLPEAEFPCDKLVTENDNF
jgi:hypothetical protein